VGKYRRRLMWLIHLILFKFKKKKNILNVVRFVYCTTRLSPSHGWCAIW
jgi:hypothetical protein